MKRNFIFVLILSVFGMFGCSSTEDTPDGPDDKKTIELDLFNSEQLRLWHGTACNFEAKDEREYTIESTDPSIASAKVEGKVFTVKTHSPGEVNLLIKDNVGNELTIECCSRTFDGHWAEELILADFYRNSINVVTDNRTIAESIRTELKELKADDRYYWTYKFTENSDNLLLYRAHQAIPIEGTYSTDFEARTLTLNYDGITENYRYNVMPILSNANTEDAYPKYVMEITQDFTEEYRTRYPDAGIEEVNVIRYMVSRGDFWSIYRVKE